MYLIKDIIDSHIMTAMKQHNQFRTEVYRAIKASLLNWETAKENVGKQMTEADEFSVIKKMVKQRQDSAEQYQLAGRQELAEKELDEISVLKEFLPEEVTKEQIEELAIDIIKTFDYVPTMKDMGKIVKAIKDRLPNADGKLVAEVVKSKLN